MVNKKIVSYISFALKSGNVIFGMDDILKSKKKSGVILYKEDLSEKNLNKITSKIDAPSLCLTNELNEFKKLGGAKVILITDINLSKAIISNAK